jgi:hypothetical protein
VLGCCQLNSPVIGNGWKNGRLLARAEDGWAVRIMRSEKSRENMKMPKNSRKPWTQEAIQEVRKLAAEETPTPLIAHKTGRSKEA